MTTCFVPRRRWIGFVLMAGAAAASLGGASTAAAAVNETKAQAVAVEAMPDWVRDRSVPAATPARVERAQDGTVYLLNDQQFRARADGHDDWFRFASKVIDRSGLESAGQLTLTYDPAFETVGVAFIRVIRDGKVIDLTRETQFRIVERESDLKDGIVNGSLKVMANLRDVRVGDVVDYATIVHTRSTLWAGQSFHHFSQRFSDPLALRTIRMVWPSGMTPAFKALNSDIAFKTRAIDGGTEWEWSAEDPAPAKGEANVPDGAFQWGRVDVSTMARWADVAAWANGLYQGDETLPADFTARLDAIAKASPAAADRLTAASRYVQDNIRYVGEELGEGSYVPRRPSTVLARGYGDCKDKSLLLALALRRLGIDAVPALVSTSAGERLPDRLPAPTQFDHVIVRAVVDGRVMWIDPTGTHRGGRGAAIVASDLGYALPIRAGQAALEKMEGFADHAGRMSVVEQFAVDEKAPVAMTLHVETRFTEARADQVRAQWASGSARSIADNNLDFYRKRFPGITESRPLVLKDDRDANALTMVEDYTLSHDAFDKAKLSAKFVTRAYALQNVLPDRQTGPRRNPLELPDHIVNEQVIELRVKDRILQPLADIDAKSGPIGFSRVSTRLPDGLRLAYRLDTGTRASVPATDADAVYTVSDQVGDETGIEFYLEKSGRPSEIPGGLDPTLIEAIRPDMEKVQALIEKPDQASKVEALSLIARMSEKLPHPSPAAGLIDGLKGAVLSMLQRPQAALAAFRSATEQFDGNPQVYRAWIGYELDQGTAESAVKALRRTRAVQPEVLASLDEQWIRLALQKVQRLPVDQRTPVREDICLTLVEGGWQQSPRTPMGEAMLGCALMAQARRGQVAEARTLIAQSPPTGPLVVMGMDRRYQALWPELDRLAADHFRGALQAELARSAAAAKAAPGDYKVVMRHMQALRSLGRFDQAIAAGKAMATDRAKIEMVGSDGFWLVNEYAAALNMAGRNDEAIAAMENVLTLGIGQYPELGSLAINHAEMLMSAGRNQAAVDRLNTLATDHSASLSPFGQAWIWADRGCALYRMGRIEESKADEAKLTAKPSENWGAVTRIAACRGDVSAVANLLIARLRDEDARAGVMEQFLTFETPEAQLPADQPILQTLAKARATPALQAEFAKYGRTLRYAGTTQGWSTN
ncbi:DUF3857 domain-containing protein [Sphingomonas sp. Xoc002]|uniref:DUF3857 domain-containing protein n=1 Tax=Sphingomonas sp. Xoc002 TaxID=2837624 RepID=UPI003D17351B